MNKKIINIAIVIILFIFIGLSGYFYYQLRDLKNNSKEGTTAEVKDLVGKVSRLYLIPNGEDPTVATVSDPNILKDQSFFNLSEKGDKVLIFTKAGRAVLYRPSLDKIIEVAPIKNNSITSQVNNDSNLNQDVSTPKEKSKIKSN